MAKGPTFTLPPPSPDADKRAVRNAIGSLNRWIDRNRREVFKKDSDILYNVPSTILYEVRFNLFIRCIKDQGWMVDVQSLSTAKRLKLIPPLKASFFEMHKTTLIFVGIGALALVLAASFYGGC